MLQRRRREARFHIEQLEGRNAPSIIVTSATVPKESGNGSFTIHGYTTQPTLPGDRISFTTSVCCGTAHYHRRPGKGEATVRGDSLGEPLKTGDFTAHIHPDYIYPYRYGAGEVVTVNATTVPVFDGQIVDRTTGQVRIELIVPGSSHFKMYRR
jgi:hypothetical protein